MTLSSFFMTDFNTFIPESIDSCLFSPGFANPKNLSLSENKKLILEIARIIRIGFLQQNALNVTDTAVPIKKQFKMMQTVIILYERSLKLVQETIPLSEIKKLGFFEEYCNLKFQIKNDELEKFDRFNTKIKSSFKKLEEEYKAHI